LTKGSTTVCNTGVEYGTSVLKKELVLVVLVLLVEVEVVIVGVLIYGSFLTVTDEPPPPPPPPPQAARNPVAPNIKVQRIVLFITKPKVTIDTSIVTNCQFEVKSRK